MTIVTPAPRRSRLGNRTTALRLAGLLRGLGARVRIAERWRGEACDLLFAVHARKSAASVLAAAAALPHLRVAVLLAGTDIYPQFAPDAATTAALDRADALIALQPEAIAVLPPHLRPRARTIVQSATAVPGVRARDRFATCVVAHLRPIKDPLLPFAAVAALPASPRIECVLAGGALDADLAAAARAAAARDPRCRWVGELDRRGTRRLIASSHLCIVPSRAEGGANVVSEAIAAGTPLAVSRVPGNLGLLGADWPAQFSTGDAGELAALLAALAGDSRRYDAVVARTLALQHLVAPARERAELARLCTDLGISCERR